jgi:iron complex outermembrane receptor protein
MLALQSRPRLLAGLIHAALLGSLLLAGHAFAADTTTADPQDTEATTKRSAATTLSGVEVHGIAEPITAEHAGGQVAKGGRMGVLGNQDLMSVPFSMTSYTATLIKNQQARSLGDVVANDPAVRTGFGFGNYSQTFVIRGFTLNSDDIAFDGLYGVLPRQLLSPEMVDRVEVFKGASAFLNGVTPGSSGLGGGINIAPKRAGDAPVTELTADYAGHGQAGGSVDVSRRFGADNAYGIRVNAVSRDGGTSIDDENRRIKALAVAFDYRGDAFRITADVGYQKQDIDGGRSVVYYSTVIPRAPSARTNYSPRFASSMLEDTYAMVRAEYDFTPWLTAYVAAGGHHDNEFGDYASPAILDDAGTTSGYRLSVPYKADTATGEAGLNAHFDTGPVTHQLTVGVSALNTRKASAFEYGNIYTGNNLYQPVDVAYEPGGFTQGSMSDPNTTGRNILRSVSVSDTLGFADDSVLLTLGVRRQKLQTVGYDYDQVKDADYRKTATTPALGLVYKPTENISVYANHIEGLAAGDTAPTSAVNFGQVFAPVHSKQNELGVKFDNGNVGSSFALFQIKQPVGVLNLDTKVYGMAGDQRNRGAEWSFFGSPAEGLRLLGGATYIKADMLDTADAATEGNYAIGVPRFQANLGAEWDLPFAPNITLTARGTRTDQAYASTDNSLKIPGWTTWDAGARIATTLAEGYPLTFRVQALNLFNKAYWASVNSQGYLSQGNPRTVMVSATIDL